MDWNKLEQDAFTFLNLTPHELYEFTSKEYNNMIEGYRLRREIQFKDIQCQAWYNANFVGSVLSGTELPKLEDIMTLSVSKPIETKDNDNLFISLAVKRNLKVPKNILKQLGG